MKHEPWPVETRLLAKLDRLDRKLDVILGLMVLSPDCLHSSVPPS